MSHSIKGLSLALSATVLTGLAGFSASALAATKAGVTLDDTLSFQGKNLVLNGLGLRTKAIFKVYVGGLYVEQKSTDPQAILNSPGAKILKLKFLRDVGVESIRDAWKDGFAKNCLKECPSYKADLETLSGMMEGMKEGQVLAFEMTPDTLGVSIDGKAKGEIKKPKFSQEVLAIFLGQEPPNAALKSGLLGAE